MTSELKDIANRILGSTDYMQVFGAVPGGGDALAHVKHTYRQMARTVHPDLHQGDPLANRAFSRLGDLYAQAKTAALNGDYGNRRTLAAITTKKGEHHLMRTAAGGDLTATYLSETVLRNGEACLTFCKVAKNPADADLIQAEARTLKRLREGGTDTSLHPFLPELLDAFAIQQTGKPKLQANVLRRLEGFRDLTEVMRAYPDGVHALDMAWMWRKLLYVLGYVHYQEVIHGAVLPQHVMILPDKHGLVLTDWCYASQKDGSAHEPIKALVSAYKDWYPAEVLGKSNPGPATDILMAARTMTYLMGGDPKTGNYPGNSNVPRPIRAFFKGCMQPAIEARPQNAWELLAEFDELLERLGPPYYPRRFRPFYMP
jgi:hypothetical protein